MRSHFRYYVGHLSLSSYFSLVANPEITDSEDFDCCISMRPQRPQGIKRRIRLLYPNHQHQLYNGCPFTGYKYPFSKINQDIPYSPPSTAQTVDIRPFSPALGGIRQVGHPRNFHFRLTEKLSVFGVTGAFTQTIFQEHSSDYPPPAFSNLCRQSLRHAAVRVTATHFRTASHCPSARRRN
jgi:hypothetical protein